MDLYTVSKAGYSLYNVQRYLDNELVESTTVDLMRNPQTTLDNKRLSLARRYASEGCPNSVCYRFSETGAILTDKKSYADLVRGRHQPSDLEMDASWGNKKAMKKWIKKTNKGISKSLKAAGVHDPDDD